MLSDPAAVAQIAKTHGHLFQANQYQTPANSGASPGLPTLACDTSGASSSTPKSEPTPEMTAMMAQMTQMMEANKALMAQMQAMKLMDESRKDGAAWAANLFSGNKA